MKIFINVGLMSYEEDFNKKLSKRIVDFSCLRLWYDSSPIIYSYIEMFFLKNNLETMEYYAYQYDLKNITYNHDIPFKYYI
jgi:hypothetical protein